MAMQFLKKVFVNFVFTFRWPMFTNKDTIFLDDQLYREIIVRRQGLLSQ